VFYFTCSHVKRFDFCFRRGHIWNINQFVLQNFLTCNYVWTLCLLNAVVAAENAARLRIDDGDEDDEDDDSEVSVKCASYHPRSAALMFTAASVTVTVVTEALVLLLEDRGRITESIRILMPVDRMKQKCFHITTKRVRRSQQFQLRR